MRYLTLLAALLLVSVTRADEPAVVATSPDNSLQIVESATQGADDSTTFIYQVKVGGHSSKLNANDKPEDGAYSAGFRFSPDGKWLVRMQKIAAGESTLYLYHRLGDTFLPASQTKLGDLAWNYFFRQPEAHGVDKSNLSPETILVKGFDENYKSLGESWPDSRYIVISLFSGESGTTPIGPWRCVYDTQTSGFSLPPDIAAFNKSKMPWKR